jgi:putative inorganic carbon (HCO3(-)) transporter
VLSIATLAGPWPRLGVVAAAALAAMAMLARTDERRAWAMLGALVLAPALLLDDVWHSSQLHFVHHHPAEAIVGAVLILIVLAGAAMLIRRRPWVVAPLTALTVPFRVPIQTATTNNLLVPLYFVVAASALAWLVPVLWSSRAEAQFQAARAEPPRPRAEPLLFEKLLAAFIVLYALQALYSPSAGFVKAVQNEVFFYVPFALLFARLRDLEWTRQLLIRCLQVTVALAVAFSLIGFVEEATKHLLLSSKLVIENELHEYFTVNSVFFDPNIFGRYLALVMVLLTAVLLYDRRTRVQLASVGALAILWGCLVFTLSRSSLVALGLGMGVLAALRWKTRPVLYLAAAVIVAGGIAIAVRPASFGLSKANGGINGGTSGRGDLITNGIQLFGDRPVYGFGSGSFTPEYASHFRKAAESVSDSHNIPVTVAAEQGIIGELAYLALVITAIIALFRGARGDPFRVGIAAAFLALLLHTLLYAAFLEDPITWTLLAIGGSLAIAARADPRPDGPTRPLRAVA